MMTSPGSPASAAASRGSRRAPHGSIRTTGPGLCARIDSTASITGPGFSTMPGPPPNGMSSTWRCLSCVWSRRSCAWSSITPRSMARPITPCRKAGPNMAGKMVTTSNLISVAVFRVLGVEQPVGHHDAATRDVHLDDGVLGRRDQVLDRTSLADPHIVGRALENLLDHAEVASRAGHDGHAHHLAVGEAPGLQRPHLFVRHLHVASAKQLGHGPVLDAAELDHEAGVALAAPLHLAREAVQQEAGARVEAILEVCQGNHLDSSVQSVRPRHLPDSNHPDTSPLGRRPRGGNCCPGIGALARSTKTRLRSRSDATRTRARMASMLPPALPLTRPLSSSASFTLLATVPPPRSNASP